MRRWYFRHARSIIYVGAGVSAVAVTAVAALAAADAHDLGAALVQGRQLFGLWALGLLLASMLIGPATSMFAWVPLKATLMYGRRAVGVSAMAFAALHVGCYGISVARRGLADLYGPGVLWVLGLLVGLTALTDMTLLACTSTDAAVKRLGGRRWKRLHRTVYALLGIVLLHALMNGADFGLARAPDVTAAPDAGALIGFLSVSAAWLLLFLLRHKGVRWPSRRTQ